MHFGSPIQVIEGKTDDVSIDRFWYCRNLNMSILDHNLINIVLDAFGSLL